MRHILPLAIIFLGACSDPAPVLSGQDDNTSDASANACQANAKFCNGNELTICKPDGSGFTTITCSSGCNEGMCASGGCIPNTKNCRNDKLAQHCDANGSPQLFMCDNLCLNGDCQSIECVAGLTFCEPDGDKILLCSPDGLEISEIENCEFGCNPATVQCIPAACSPGEVRCSTSDPNRIEQCQDNRKGFEATNIRCQEKCVSGECYVSACIPGAQRCGLEGVEECISDGTGFKPYTPCQWGCLESNNKEAICAKCAGNLVGANSNNPTWIGGYRCNNNAVEFCQDPFTPWVVMKKCEDIDSCVQASCVKLLTLSDNQTSDENRLRLVEALADCWLVMKKGNSPKKDVCREINAGAMSYDILKDELAQWFCEGHKEGTITADKVGDQSHLDAAHDIMGCGWLNVNDLTFKTIGKKVTGGTVGVECIGYESNEVIVGLCGEL